MTASVIVHPAYVARMSLGQLVIWGDRFGLVASNARTVRGDQRIVLERVVAKAVRS